MQNSIANIKHDEWSYFDFVVKERLARLIASKTRGITCDFGARYDSENACLYHIPFEDFNGETEDFKFFVVDLNEEDVLEYETDWSYPVSLNCFVSLCYNNTISVNGVRERTDEDIISVVCAYTDSLEEGMEGHIISFVRSYEKYLKGEKEEALSDPVFRGVCENLAYIFSPKELSLPVEFAADNAGLLLNSFLTGDEETNRVVVFASKEMASYENYRHRLPSDVRRLADDYMAVCRKPIWLASDTHCRHMVYGDVAVTLIVEVLADDLNGEVRYGYEDLAMESIMCPRGFNVYFESSVWWLDKNLKDLRQKYESA